MGNILCPWYFNPDLEEGSEDLTRKLRKQMKRISFKPTKDFNAETMATKVKTVKEYKILCQVGRGLFSQVYLAVDPSGRKVGLKVIRKKNFTTKQSIEKIIIECKKALSFSNSTISEISYDLGFSNEGNFTNFIKKHTGKNPSEMK